MFKIGDLVGYSDFVLRNHVSEAHWTRKSVGIVIKKAPTWDYREKYFIHWFIAPSDEYHGYFEEKKIRLLTSS